MNFHVLIFSKDRAMQLEATLRSLYTMVQDIQHSSISVLFKTSSDRYASQYQNLMKQFAQVKFVEETDFQGDVYKILVGDQDRKKRSWINLLAKLNHRPLIRGYSFSEIILRFLLRSGFKGGYLPFEDLWNSQYCLFSVDDCIFIKPFTFNQIIKAIEKTPQAIGFSLRLGSNTNYCYMNNSAQEVPRFLRLNEDILYFEWGNAEYDFGYPLELSSSVYRSSTVIPLIFSLYYTTPNMLESKLASMSRWYGKRFPYLLCFESSVAFSIPLNKVQRDRPLNRFSANPHYSPEALALLFDEGKRIDLCPLMNLTPNSCHQEVGLEFVEIGDG
ncbi:MAG: Glycosyltransferase [Anaerolineae bacterium]|jgi:hypothetical protein|nr:MAG: Glycosyltransferase [Anaerolineae bacterium]